MKNSALSSIPTHCREKKDDIRYNNIETQGTRHVSLLRQRGESVSRNATVKGTLAVGTDGGQFIVGENGAISAAGGNFSVAADGATAVKSTLDA